MAQPLELLALLQPRRRERVYDLLQQIGMDVADWANYKKSNAPAANPKYCYEWSFTQADRLVVLNLWHASLVVDGSSLICDLNLRADASAIERAQDEPWRASMPKPIWAKRARSMDKALQLAWRTKVPVRVIVCEGTMRDLAAGDEKASEVRLRSLDPAPWTLISYEWETGQARLLRSSSSDVERSSAETAVPRPLRPDTPASASFETEWEADERLLADIEGLTLAHTEKLALVKARINQSGYRQRLLARWEMKCSVTGLAHADVLIASHIFPWSLCKTPKDRWSVDNGLLLSPGLDKAFELGLIGFDTRGKIILSKRAERVDVQGALGIDRNHSIRNYRLYPGLEQYLEQHRKRHEEALSGRS